ncbi:MAG: DUF1624 domain-containing protein [Bryobacterales bacterium]|nr:DUF1624 domain-containing protein [Bryobacterales bacterium]
MRVHEIDLLRGVIMAIMVVDHAREYAAGPGRLTDPMDLTTVTPLLFFLRWLSHFCAPVFALLMGVSAGLARSAGPGHFIARGLILIAFEFTIVDWSWTFYPPWPRKFFQVIGALGVSSILLGCLLPLGRHALWGAGLAIVAFHNLFDAVTFDPASAAHYVWAFLHQRSVLPLGAGFEVRTSYPFLPMAGVVLVGYGLGPWLFSGGCRRYLTAGAVCLALFLALRVPNLYGDASRFTVYPDWVRTLESLGNVTKYPLSLQFVLMTVGGALLFLASLGPRRSVFFETLGRTPMFFYIGHLYLLHLLALLWAAAAGFALAPLSVRYGGIPAGFAFPLWMSVPFAAAATLLLYPACRWYAPRRRRYL